MEKHTPCAGEPTPAAMQGKPQLYGTQFKKVDDRWVLWDVDPTPPRQ